MGESSRRLCARSPTMTFWSWPPRVVGRWIRCHPYPRTCARPRTCPTTDYCRAFRFTSPTVAIAGFTTPCATACPSLRPAERKTSQRSAHVSRGRASGDVSAANTHRRKHYPGRARHAASVPLPPGQQTRGSRPCRGSRFRRLADVAGRLVAESSQSPIAGQSPRRW